MDKMNWKILIYISLAVLIILVIPNAIAFGVTPGRTTIDFQPGLKEKVGFTILNNDHKDIKIAVFVQGELNESISLKETQLEIKASENSKELEYIYELPEKLKPGIHTAEIVVLELPEKAEGFQVAVGASVAVITQLAVHVPYPGKYIIADLFINSANTGEEVAFVIPVINRGSKDLKEVKASIEVYNKSYNRVASILSESISIKALERKELTARWIADVPVGNYTANITVIFDEESIKLEKQFTIGGALLELLQIQVKDFTLGEIAKFEMFVENKWSETIKNAFSQTNVYDSEGNVMADFKSPTYDLNPLSTSTMVSYWDTADVKEGTYDTTVDLNYGEKVSEKYFKLKVTENEITAIGLGYVISEKQRKGGSLTTILIIVIVVLVLINIVWFLVLRKLMLKKKGVSTKEFKGPKKV